jgi:DNA replication protein DnaC
MDEMTAGPDPQQLWTPETMYDDNPACIAMGIHKISKAFRAALETETRWVRIQEMPTLSWELGKAVGLGERCPLCDNHRSVEILCRGQVTGIEMERSCKCPCILALTFWNEFKQVDSRFRDARLSRLTPSARVSTTLERQAELHNLILENPGDNFLFLGPPGTGKTYLAAALFQNAVLCDTVEQMAARVGYRTCWWASTSVLLNQHVAWETCNDKRETPDPRECTEEKIRRCVKTGGRPLLVLDELDKIATSDFKIRRLGEIINCVYAVGGQLIATMNKTADELARAWTANESETILRRIGGDGGHTVYVG